MLKFTRAQAALANQESESLREEQNELFASYSTPEPATKKKEISSAGAPPSGPVDCSGVKELTIALVRCGHTNPIVRIKQNEMNLTPQRPVTRSTKNTKTIKISKGE